MYSDVSILRDFYKRRGYNLVFKRLCQHIDNLKLLFGKINTFN